MFARSRVSTRLDYICRAGVGRMLLTVDDDGPGVPEAERDAVFERFERGGAEAGAGFGLAIARALVLRMGGAIGVSEGPLGGARFWVELPEDPAPLTGEAAGGDPAFREASR
jgi:Signal transduction histidine kinase